MKVNEKILSKRHPKLGCLEKRNRKGKGEYTRVPASTSIDWLLASRKVEPVEVMTFTEDRETKSFKDRLKEVKEWLKH